MATSIYGQPLNLWLTKNLGCGLYSALRLSTKLMTTCYLHPNIVTHYKVLLFHLVPSLLAPHSTPLTPLFTLSLPFPHLQSLLHVSHSTFQPSSIPPSTSFTLHLRIPHYPHPPPPHPNSTHTPCTPPPYVRPHLYRP